MPNVYLTSDEHYGHRQIIAYSGRPFRDIGHMEEELIRRHNAVVTADDTVIHLGDFSLDEGYVPYVVPQLRGKHILISGNHDQTWHSRRDKQHMIRKYQAWGFAAVYDGREPLCLDDFAPGVLPVSTIMHHLPYAGDHTSEERYAVSRPKDCGLWLLHGHVHGLWRRRDRMINVGVDVWDYAPVSLDQIRALMTATLPASWSHVAPTAMSVRWTCRASTCRFTSS